MKISVVMQSYLGDYPGSRINPEYKFTRAVHSFLSQKHKDKELIIVADGCDITKRLYEQLYSHDSRIKLCYIAKSKDMKRMYMTDNVEDTLVKYFRGTPKRLGCSIAEGDVITYMDSDDIMLSNRLSDLNDIWSKTTVNWGSNVLRYVHKNALLVPNLESSVTDINKRLDLSEYDIVDDFYLNITVPAPYIFGGTYGLTHKKDVKASWKDSTLVASADKTRIISGSSEDHLFLNELIKYDGPCFRQESASYVVCHFRGGLWDV